MRRCVHPEELVGCQVAAQLAEQKTEVTVHSLFKANGLAKEETEDIVQIPGEKGGHAQHTTTSV
jgi:hypothetical protein